MFLFASKNEMKIEKVEIKYSIAIAAYQQKRIII